jgi:hypothetical protein
MENIPKQELEDIVKKEIDKINLPIEYKIVLKTYEEVYPRYDDPKLSTLIQISLGSKREDSMHDLKCSYLDFWYNKKEDRIDNINFSLKGELLGKGYGRKLVKSMEKIGRKLNCKTIRINLDTNNSFWKHMGYKKEDSYTQKKLKYKN